MFPFLHFRTLLKLGSLLWSNNIPLLVCRSYGFIGCMRIVLQEHCGKLRVGFHIIPMITLYHLIAEKKCSAVLYWSDWASCSDHVETRSNMCLYSIWWLVHPISVLDISAWLLWALNTIFNDWVFVPEEFLGWGGS